MKEFQLNFITNKQTVRTLKLLAILQNNQQFTLKELANITETSDRTTLEDIQKIRKYFSDTIYLDSSNSGYSLNILAKKKFLEKKRALLKEEPLFKIIESVFFNELKSLDIWSDFLFTSINTLNKQLNHVKRFFDEYELTLEKSPVNLIGDELNIRQFFHDFYYESDITPHTVFPSLAVQDITMSIKSDSFFSDYTYISFTEFNYIVFITLQRFSSGNPIKKTSDTGLFLEAFLTKHLAAVNLNEIKNKIMKYYKVTLTLTEALYLYTQLLTRRSLLSVSAEETFVNRFNLWKEPKSLAVEYAKIFNIPSHALALSHIFYESFFINIKIKYLYAPIFITQISDVTIYVQNKFPDYFNKTQQFLIDNVSSSMNLSEKQINSISAALVLYTNSMRTFYWNTSKNIAFLLEGNRFIVEDIRTSTNRYLGKFHSLFFPDVTELSNDYFKNNKIDYLVTNYSEYLLDLEPNCETIVFEMIPTLYDWNYLLYQLNPSAKIDFNVY